MGKDHVTESVPRLASREGDRVIKGSNNSVLVLGRDRVRDVDSGRGDEAEAGSIHAVVGMHSEDFDPESDSAFFVVSMKSDPDDAYGTAGVERDSSGVSSVVLKGDSVRIIASRDVKVVVGSAYLVLSEDGSVVIEGDVKLGRRAQDELVKRTAAAVYNSHTHAESSGGTTGTPLPQMNSSHFTKKTRAE